MLLLVSCLFLHLYPAFAYLYPDRLYEELEHLLVDTNGYNSGHFAVGVTPCTLYFQGPQTTGRQTSAQWMRVAFHDFSTANVAAGTGGIDASIGFETTRPENSGIAMNDSLSYWAPFVNTYASMADMVALGSTVASAACGGPIFPFKGGRISATQAGEFGVPEPDEELQPTLERFAGAGFSQTRAIQLTACGHTIGSVHHAGFPLIVDTSVVTPNNTQGGIHFDDTVAVFDNHVVTEYIDGTTPNPLVTSFNVSQRSDLRLFSSDNNATMQGLQDAATFASVCTDVFTQMLNTVPSGVSLRDITPIPLKPVNIQLGVSSAGTATLTGAIRFLGTSFASNSKRKVTIAWTTRTGFPGGIFLTSPPSSSTTGSSIYAVGSTFYHTFSIPINPKVGISTFTIFVDEGNGKPPAVYANGGKGYPIQDTVAWLQDLTTISANSDGISTGVTVAAAVRGTASSVSAVFSIPTPVIGTQNPSLTGSTIPLASASPLGSSGYSIYTGSIQIPSNIFTVSRTTFDLEAVVGGKTYVDDFRKLAVLDPWVPIPGPS